MAEYLTTDTDLTAVANAIRTKGGTSAQLTYPAGFVSAIEAIPTGGGGTPVTFSIADSMGAVRYVYYIDDNGDFNAAPAEPDPSTGVIVYTGTSVNTAMVVVIGITQTSSMISVSSLSFQTSINAGARPQNEVAFYKVVAG